MRPIRFTVFVVRKKIKQKEIPRRYRASVAQSPESLPAGRNHCTRGRTESKQKLSRFFRARSLNFPGFFSCLFRRAVLAEHAVEQAVVNQLQQAGDYEQGAAQL